MNDQKYNELLIDYVEGLLSDDQAQEVREFAASSPERAQQLTVLQEGMLFALHTTLYEPPASLDEKILAMARDIHPVPAQPPFVEEQATMGWLERLFAMPSFKPVMAFCTIVLVVGAVFVTQKNMNKFAVLRPSDQAKSERQAIGTTPTAPVARLSAPGKTKPTIRKKMDSLADDRQAVAPPRVSQHNLQKVPTKPEGFAPNKAFAPTPPAARQAPEMEDKPIVGATRQQTGTWKRRKARRIRSRKQRTRYARGTSLSKGSPARRKSRYLRYKRKRLRRQYRRRRSRLSRKLEGSSYKRGRVRQRSRRARYKRRPLRRKYRRRRGRLLGKSQDAGDKQKRTRRERSRYGYKSRRARGNRHRRRKKRTSLREQARGGKAVERRSDDTSSDPQGDSLRKKEISTARRRRRSRTGRPSVSPFGGRARAAKRRRGSEHRAGRPSLPSSGGRAHSVHELSGGAVKDAPKKAKVTPRKVPAPVVAKAPMYAPPPPAVTSKSRSPVLRGTSGVDSTASDMPRRKSPSAERSTTTVRGPLVQAAPSRQPQQPMKKSKSKAETKKSNVLSFELLMKRGQSNQRLYEKRRRSRYFARALADYQRSLQLARRSRRTSAIRRASFSLGLLFLRAGNVVQAKRHFRDYIRTFPRHQQAQAASRVALRFANAGYSQQARYFYKKAGKKTTDR